MYKTADLITADYIRLKPTTTLEMVIQAFIEHRSDLACVVADNNLLLGIVTKYMVYRLVLQGASLQMPVINFYRQDVTTLHIEDDFNDIRNKLLAANVANAVVVNDAGGICGVFSKSDLLRGLHWEREIFINRLDLVIENLPIGILVVNRRNKITHSNKAVNDMLGLTLQSTGENSFATCFPELNSFVQEVALTKRKLILPKIRVRNINCMVSLIPSFEPNLKDITIMFQELSSLENVAMELRTTQVLTNTFHTILQNTSDLLIITDLLGNITFHSGNLTSNFSDLPKDLGGRNIGEIITGLANVQLALLPESYCEIQYIGTRNYLVSLHKVKNNLDIYGYIFKINQELVDPNLMSKLQTLESMVGVSGLNDSQTIDEPPCLTKIVTANPIMKNMKKELQFIAKTNSTVLVLGESGTGKELIANAVHELSGRTGNFIKINCAAIPLELLESELFGYEEGAFTGARKGGKPGKFEMAHKGTLFLDEIGDMPLSLQAKLLRVLEEKCFERIGGTTTIASDIRFIAATNKNLRSTMLEGKFREDLFYRLNVIKFEIPPLRERTEDIPILIDYFLQNLNKKYQKNVTGISTEAIYTLVNNEWHGNIRELINVIERAIIWCQEPVLSKRYFSFMNVQPFTVGQAELSSEKESLIQLLEHYYGNKSKVAEHLGISRVTLYKKLKRYGILENINYK